MLHYSDDIIYYIIDYLYNTEDKLNLKKTCKYFNKYIRQFSLAKKLLVNKLTLYSNILNCVNIDCYYDTMEIYENIYHYDYQRYIHFHQNALNKTYITINNQKYIIDSPYCCECLKKYILIRDRQNVYDHLSINYIYINYM